MTKIGRPNGGQQPTTPSSDSEVESFEQNERGEQFNRGSQRHPVNPQNDTDMRMLITAAERFWQQIKQIFNYIMIELGGYQIFDKIAQWCVRNPHISLCLVAASVTFMLPFLIFLGFGISTILMTFTGFLVLEGTLLTIVSMLIFGCLCVVVMVFLFFIATSIAIYFGFTQIYDLYGGVNRHKAALLTFLQNEQTSRRTSSHRTQRSFSSGDIGCNNVHQSRNNIENITQ